MSADITHRLVGYDKTTGRVALEHEISPDRLDLAKRIAGVGVDDPEAALCYKLTDRQVRELASAIGARVDAEAWNFYMEGFAAPSRAR